MAEDSWFGVANARGFHPSRTTTAGGPLESWWPTVIVAKIGIAAVDLFLTKGVGLLD